MKGILVVTVGLPSSGKTSWVDDFIRENQGKVIDVISSDKIREEARNCDNTMKVIAVDNKNNCFDL